MQEMAQITTPRHQVGHGLEDVKLYLPVLGETEVHAP